MMLHTLQRSLNCNNMGRICTNPHQSKQLIDHGFSINAADLWWSEYVTFNHPSPTKMRIAEPVLYSYRNTDDDLPAWSLTTLLQALPGEIMWEDKRYVLHITKAQEFYLIEYTGEQNSFIYKDGRDLIDICVQVILHLINNNIPLNSSYIFDNI